jgi:hypothetical protein
MGANLTIGREKQQRKKNASPSLRKEGDLRCKLQSVKWTALGTLHVSSFKSNEMWLRQRRVWIGYDRSNTNDIGTGLFWDRNAYD